MLRSVLNCGFELEFEIPLSLATPDVVGYEGKNSQINAINLAKKTLGLNFGVIKYDGTIKNGFELASIVLPDNVYLSSRTPAQKRFWTNFFNKIKKLKVSVGDHVGMHVHIDKTQLTKEIVEKLNYFIFRNKDFVCKIGGREPTKSCKAIENVIEWVPNSPLALLPKQPNNKYLMLNVVRLGTLEFRFFKSVCDYKTFVKNMQFVIAMVRFTEESKFTVEEFKAGGAYIADCEGKLWDLGQEKTIEKAFCKFVNKKKKDFKELNTFINQHKLGK